MSHSNSEQRESFEQANQPTLCATGCGFFANPACMNMCSKCYRDFTADQERNAKGAELLAGAAAATDPVVPAAPVLATPPAPVVEQPAAPAASPAADAAAPSPAPASSGEPGADDDGRPVQKNKNRCFECNKRVGLTGIACRCGYVYCASHRYAEAHKCTFDYKAAGRQTLERNNPVVAAAKLEKF